MPCQQPMDGALRAEVNTIVSVTVPMAFKVPRTSSDAEESNFITTPGLMVSVAALKTTTFPETMYGLPEVVQVVFEKMLPDTAVCEVAPMENISDKSAITEILFMLNIFWSITNIA